jgi:hypothetical protein
MNAPHKLGKENGKNIYQLAEYAAMQSFFSRAILQLQVIDQQ